MRQRAVLFAGLLGALILVGNVQADRTPSTRTSGQKSFGSKVDVTVPFLTTGRSAFGAYRVKPIIYSSPSVSDPENPQTKKVYNLPFYGSKQGYGDKSNGATERKSNRE